MCPNNEVLFISPLLALESAAAAQLRSTGLSGIALAVV